MGKTRNRLPADISFSSSEMFRKFKKQNPSFNGTQKDYSAIFKALSELFFETLWTNKYDVLLPGICYFTLENFKPNHSRKVRGEDKRYIPMYVDYSKKGQKLVYFENRHTDGYVFKHRIEPIRSSSYYRTLRLSVKQQKKREFGQRAKQGLIKRN